MILQLAFVLTAIIVGARLGGIGLGVMGGVGLAILTFGFGLQQTNHYYRKKYDALPKSRLYETMVQENFGKYKGYAGVMQQYIFYYERTVLHGRSS